MPPSRVRRLGYVVRRRRLEGERALERTYGRLMFHRGLARDYETLPARSEAMIHFAVTDLMTRSLAGETTTSWRDGAKRHRLQLPG